MSEPQAPEPRAAGFSAKAILVVALVVGAIIVLGWGAGIYNGLVGSQERMRTAWAQVETVLQRRYDLIPNLVETVKGYAAHERGVLEEVTRLRGQWASAGTVAEKAEAAGQLEGALARLMVVVEQYPDLKADERFRDLQVSLEGTENRIAVERQRYNDAVRDYNTKVRSVPASLVASLTGFAPSDAYFESAEPAREAPKVDFGTEKKG